MDTKSLAKSKRAHSLHHSKKTSHPHKKSSLKPQLESPGNKAPSKHALPSNWDRYDEQIEPSSGDSSNIVAAADASLPKSKGADFRYLIAEAQSQYQSSSYSDEFLLVDDLLPGDYDHGVGSMLSVRGEGILSWLGNDNFVVEEGTSTSHEASFLSLNLHTLAEQLAKIDASERLFIEADVLPPEMCGQGSKISSNQEYDQMPATESETSTSIPTEKRLVNQSTEVISSGTIGSGNSYPIPFNQGSDLLSPVKEPPAFEAATAEAELDMLLDSFSETNLLESSSSTSGFLPGSQKEASIGQPQLTSNVSSQSKTAPISAVLDDVLDDLLEEASILSNQNGLHKPGKVNAATREIPISSSSESMNKSKVLDDFDSWLDTI